MPNLLYVTTIHYRRRKVVWPFSCCDPGWSVYKRIERYSITHTEQRDDSNNNMNTCSVPSEIFSGFLESFFNVSREIGFLLLPTNCAITTTTIIIIIIIIITKDSYVRIDGTKTDRTEQQ